MKCPNCNTINPDNAQFCRNCGMNLNETDIPEEEIVHVPTIDDDGDYRQETVNSENGSSTLIACCIFVVIIFIAFAIFSFY